MGTPHVTFLTIASIINIEIDTYNLYVSQRGRAMLRVCIASTQNVEHGLLLLVVSASDYHCVQLNSFMLSSLRRIRPCYRPSQTNIRWCVADCAIYTAWSSLVGNCFWHFARPAIFDSQLSDQNRDLCLHPTCIRRHPVWYGNTRMVWLPTWKNFEDMFIRFDMIHERDRQTDRQTDGQTPHDGIDRAYA